MSSETHTSARFTVERGLRMIAGIVVLASVILGVTLSPWWLLLTGFVGLNLFQSAFTNWCPMVWVLRRLGLPQCDVGLAQASR